MFTKDYLEQGLIDTASSIFQISIMFVLFYLVNEAGGVNAAQSMHNSQNSAQNVSGSIGGGVTKTMKGRGNHAVFGSRDKGDKSKITSGGWGMKAARGLKGGFNKSSK